MLDAKPKANRGPSRCDFIKTSLAVGAGYWISGSPARARASRWANERLQFACIGVDGKGKSDSLDAARFGKIMAICDIDEQILEKASGQVGFEESKQFFDFRELLAEMGDSIDAVTVSTPDHTHAVAAVMAMNMGKHCFCQKPLTHSISEARKMAEVATANDVKTQMGNQGTALRDLRRARKLFDRAAWARFPRFMSGRTARSGRKASRDRPKNRSPRISTGTCGWAPRPNGLTVPDTIHLIGAAIGISGPAP